MEWERGLLPSLTPELLASIRIANQKLWSSEVFLANPSARWGEFTYS